MAPLSRAFVAVYPPAEVCDAVAQRLATLPVVGGLRWLPPAQWHVTLRFCGRVADADALLGALARACGPVAAVVGLRLVGGGAFPSARRGSAFWLGVAGGDPADGLTSLAAASEAACVAAGLAADDRAFRPHLTVARSSRACDLRPLVDALGDDPVGPPWAADAVRLVASDTRASGAVHTEMGRVPLVG